MSSLHTHPTKSGQSLFRTLTLSHLCRSNAVPRQDSNLRSRPRRPVELVIADALWCLADALPYGVWSEHIKRPLLFVNPPSKVRRAA